VSDETVQVEVVNVRPFLREVFTSAGAEEALRWADDRGLLQDVFTAAVSLVRSADASAIVDVVEPKSSAVDAELLIGRRYHLKVSRVSWRLVVALLPSIVTALMQAATPGVVTGMLTVTLMAIVDNLKRIDSDDWPVFLAIQRGAATRAAVRTELRTSKSAVNRSIDNLLSQGVVAKRGGRLHVVV